MNGLHDALAPAGPQAAALFALWQVMLAACVLVFVLTFGTLLVALWRSARADERTAPELDAHPETDSRLRRRVAWGLGASTLLLFALLLTSFLTDRRLAALPLQDAVHIDLVGHQFWWEATYDAQDPALRFSTANELHVPVGRPVLVRLRADDVIHSFWLPSLSGKKDLLPGRDSTIALRVDKPGIYRGQCAEFCGFQHAHMALVVVAERPADYARWAAQQRRPAAPPVGAFQQRGLALIEGSSCAMCHTIEGTRAHGRHAPDLTHLASRAWLGAGVLANTPQARADWIANPQKFKPGVNMPPLATAPDDLAAISAYLGTLR